MWSLRNRSLNLARSPRRVTVAAAAAVVVVVEVEAEVKEAERATGAGGEVEEAGLVGWVVIRI
jgi:hypothetical protein